MKTNTKILALLMVFFLYSCSQDEVNKEIETTATTDTSLSKGINTTTLTIWNFDNLNGWEDATQVGSPNYYVENGYLNIFTNPNTWERTKIKTTTTFSTGIYTWRIFVPAMGEGDMASIGAFLYNDDAHELDFEIGYGKQIIRNELSATTDDLIVYMTSQANTFQSYATKIKRNQWHTFSMELKLNSSRKYQVNWKINGLLASTAQLSYGDKTKFKIFCSLENLTFIGDHIPATQNYALFDFVEYNK